MKNLQETVKDVLSILDKANYVDPAEILYDGIKGVKREVTINTVKDLIWSLENEAVVCYDDSFKLCIALLKIKLDD